MAAPQVLAAGCPTGQCCPGGVCPNPATSPSLTSAPVPPSLSGIWPFSTGKMGGSFGPRASAAPAQTPHPSVVRIVANDGGGTMSLGSGTLIYVTEKHGLVITNWHVVRDAIAPVEVIFPDGFRSSGTVIKMDHTWDLAAVGIWRPSVDPVPLASAAPQAGETLTIAGYGSGSFRAATGRRAENMFSPGGKQPAELLEIIGAEARQGDSGGPIFNQQGQLAGVLFGASRGQTIGSYCGRVGMFLADVTPVLDRARPGSQEMLVDNLDHRASPAAALIAPPATSGQTWQSADPAGRLAAEVQQPAAALADIVHEGGQRGQLPSRTNDLLDAGLTDTRGSLRATPGPQVSAWSREIGPPAATLQNGGNELKWEDFVGTSRGEQAKSLLAGVGVIAILLFASRIMLAGGSA